METAGKNIPLFWRGRSCDGGGMKNGIIGIVGLGLFATMLFACGSGEPETQEEIIAAIEKLGGEFFGGGKMLDLADTQITDAGLAHLAGLTELKTLSLDGTQITDAGLVHLKGLKGLEKLDLYSTKVTAAGVKKLQAALPKCKIHR